ncbi:LexA/Signal peptidase, partial [Clathrospora elynae]
FVFWGTNGIAALCAMVWLRDHYIEFQHVRGSSMAPTLSPQAHETGTEDWVLVRPYLHRNNGQDNNKHGIQRGDVVTFWKPSEPREMGIKRVVALEGDEVWPARGYARDPSFRENRLGGLPDGLPDGDENALEEPGKVVVPYGHVWVEGDNWRKTWDSNDFGPISKGLIKAKAVWVWRDWFGVERVGDLRDKKERNMRSRVVEGRSEIPAVFL